MKEDIGLIKMILFDLQCDLEADCLIEPEEQLREGGKRIRDLKKRKIEALENIIQRMEDLYES